MDICAKISNLRIFFIVHILKMSLDAHFVLHLMTCYLKTGRELFQVSKLVK